ncbi:hypothetical protein AWH56_003995 [Anaerobacillus isosaccharinicus]|uniref:Uncharacterized protein n=1 Tax=Anaerobacillus isosaccharinicus TaxID=1532552 RepID=A0A7S7L9A3_9BACI|nr:hypothetical protein [Anaerobacillus isosaccharinicus]MBA5584811.1 hypothetical protein [Anaerobacillus isosaccharinicus]QOY36824.1 hypothetical protein AWH56_003995 [Anaerobacillus isosaccharinicus]
MYSFKSAVGQMLIYFDKTFGQYALKIGDTVYEHHHSAESAADNVYMHSTGCYNWDSLEGVVETPSELSAWERL